MYICIYMNVHMATIVERFLPTGEINRLLSTTDDNDNDNDDAVMIIMMIKTKLMMMMIMVIMMMTIAIIMMMVMMMMVMIMMIMMMMLMIIYSIYHIESSDSAFKTTINVRLYVLRIWKQF
jgi:small-conductance mechanosensitive channel